MSGDTPWTPGPWGMATVYTSCGVCHKIGPWPHKWRAGDEMSACIYDDYPSPPHGTDTMLANARLIAGAPEMAEALHEARRYAGFVTRLHTGAIADDARACIDKIDALLSRINGEGE